MSATRRQLMAVVLGSVVAAGCGKDANGPNQGPPDNAAPAAGFSFACTDLACSFTDLSSDTDGRVEGYAWAFGDASQSAAKDPSHAYAAGNDYSVTLTVTDNGGAENSVTKTVTVTAPVTPPPGNTAPTADFTVNCLSLDCTFVDASTDADGAIAGWAWSFGDGANSAAPAPAVHHYAATALQFMTATLTVTDNGGATSTKTVQFTVAPPAHLTCDGLGCTLRLDQPSTVKVTLQDRECTAKRNTFIITAPIAQTLLTDGCYQPAVGTSYDLNGGAVFPAGSELDAVVKSGSLKLETAPAVHVEGAYPTWTLKFDDGEDATPPEPDFNDLVITITATPQS